MKLSPINVMRNLLAVVWVAVTALMVGCAPLEPVAPAQKDAVVAAPGGSTGVDSADILRVGDRIRIIYSDIPTAPMPVEQVIPDDGKLTLHLGYSYNFAGKKRTEAEREIEAIYVDEQRVYKRIRVTIERQSSFVSVGGEVRTPASIVHRGDLTVLSAIDAAGGFTEFANRKRVIVTRAATKQQVIVNAKKAINNPKLNLLLYPGDSIQVPRSVW